jgi:hypothetical protein
MLAGAVILLTGIGAATSQEVEPQQGATLKEIMEFLAQTYGDDATVEDATINLKLKSGEIVGYSVGAYAATELIGPPWNGPPCRRYTKDPGPPERRYCANTQTVNAVTYEVQRDNYSFSGGYIWRVSELLDCHNPSHTADMYPPAETRFC